MARDLVIPGGREKGTPIEDASIEALNYWIQRIEEDLDRNPDKKFAREDRELADAMIDVVTRKSGGDAQRDASGSAPRNEAPPRHGHAEPRSQQRTRQAPRRATIPSDLMGQLTDPKAITERLKKLSESCNLISPAPACSELPVGGAVLFTFVIVDPTVNDKGNGPDVYKQKGGGYSLKGDTLTRIANAAGVKVLHRECRRLDDGKNPRYARHLSVAKWQDFDGMWNEVGRTKTIDLRDGSDQIPTTMSEKELAGKRGTINEVVESGSLNRVIRKLGVKQIYTEEELSRPFAVIRFMFTGVTDDPDLKVPMAMLKAYQMTGGEAALYGRRPGGAPALGPAAQPPAQLGSHVVDSDGVVQDAENNGARRDYDYDDTGSDDDRY